MPFEVTPIKYVLDSQPKDNLIESLGQDIEAQYNRVAAAGGHVVTALHVELDRRTKAFLLVAEMPEPGESKEQRGFSQLL